MRHLGAVAKPHPGSVVDQPPIAQFNPEVERDEVAGELVDPQVPDPHLMLDLLPRQQEIEDASQPVALQAEVGVGCQNGFDLVHAS